MEIERLKTALSRMEDPRRTVGGHILHKLEDISDKDISERYGYQVNIGVLDCELSQIRELSGSYDVLLELAE